MKIVNIDNNAVPSKVAPAILALKRESGATLVSCYRGDKAAGFLRRLGKQTQRMLYDGWRRRRPGYNPANPPKQSTHELFSDGVAYPGPRGRPLYSEWRVGTDWSNADAVLRAARKLGFVMFRPYDDPRERHHLNFKKQPRLRPTFRPLKRGSRGVRVSRLYRKLHTVERSGRRYLPALRKGQKGSIFGSNVEAAVRKYQRDQGLKADGVVGKHTTAQLDASVRYWTNKRKGRR